MVITGPPGVGKSKLAAIVAELYSAFGVFKTQKEKTPVVCVSRKDFIAKYLGQSAHQTTEFLEKNRGSVIFFDEGYSLSSSGDSSRDEYSNESIAVITKFLSENKDDICFILAGYKKDIEENIFTRNPGLARRFPTSLNIEPYTPDELFNILIKMIKTNGSSNGSSFGSSTGWRLDPGIRKQVLLPYFAKFKNSAGDIENLITKAKGISCSRTVILSTRERKIILEADLIEAAKEITKGSEDSGKFLSMYN